MGTRTPLFSQHQPGGAFGYADIRRHPGSVFFVGSTVTGASDAVGYGRNPDKPFATLDYAVGQCTASQGDVIYLLPGHVETVTAAAGLDLDVIGITIIGCGNGTLQPLINFTTIITADMDVDAANITIENVHFQSGFDDITAAIDVNCDDFTIRRCRFTQETADHNARIWIQDAADAGSDRITVEDCLIYADEATNDAFIDYSGTGDGHIFRRNVLFGDWDNIAAVGGTGVITNALIADNYIYNRCTTADSCLHFADTATGIVVNNMMMNGAAENQMLQATAMVKCQNFGAIIGEDLQGTVDPLAA
jgi:hypothetical protein